MSLASERDVRTPMLDRRPKRLLIDGQWTEATSGRVFDTFNPSTGQVIAQLAEGTRTTWRPPSPRLVGRSKVRGRALARSSDRTCC